MNDQDFDTFSDLWTAAYESVSRGKTPSASATNLAFEALRIYTVDQIRIALSRHVRDADAGRYGLTPADVVRQIDGETPTADQVIAAALKPRTPLAVLCRIEIGSHDLNNRTTYELRPLAEGCLAMFPEWRARIAAGRLTDHERERIAHYGADAGSTTLVARDPGPAMLADGGAR
jgi:hypothetical protein